MTHGACIQCPKLTTSASRSAEMGSFAEQQVADAIDAVIKRDAVLASEWSAAGRRVGYCGKHRREGCRPLPWRAAG